MRNKLTTLTLTVFLANAALGFSALSPAVLETKSERLALQASQPFDSSVPKNGVKLIAANDQVVNIYRRDGYYECYGERRNSSYPPSYNPNDYERNHCRWVEPADIERHRVDETYRIVDRNRYVDFKAKEGLLKGAAIGTFAGLALVLLAGLLFSVDLGFLALAAAALGGAFSLGKFKQSKAADKAKSAPSEFTETDYYDVEKPLYSYREPS